MTVTFDQFLQMFPDGGYTTRHGAHRAVRSAESTAREGVAAREFYDRWSEAGQPTLPGATTTPPTLSQPTGDGAADGPDSRELVGAGAPIASRARVAADHSAAVSARLAGSAAPAPAPPVSAAPGPTAPAAPAPPVSAAPGPAAAAVAEPEPKLSGWSRFKHELTRAR